MMVGPLNAAARLGFRLCDRIGPVLHDLVGLGPSSYEVESLFGQRVDARQAARASAALTCKNWNLFRLVRRFGLEALSPLVHWEGAQQLGSWRAAGASLLLVSWHAGPPIALLSALGQIRLPALCMLGSSTFFKVPEGLDYQASDSADKVGRATTLIQGIRRLRAGGTVVVVADHPWRSTHRAPVLGREADMAPGLGTLARCSDALVVPVTSRWTPSGDIAVRHWAPLAPPSSPREHVEAFEDEVYASVARWFEAYLEERPEQLEHKYIVRLISSELQRPSFT